jgi:hypothetical protein
MGGEWSASRPSRSLPLGKRLPVTIYRRLGGLHSRSGHRGWLEESSRLCRGSNLDNSVVQPTARHYTDWVTRLVDYTVTGISTSQGSPNFCVHEPNPIKVSHFPLLSAQSDKGTAAFLQHTALTWLYCYVLQTRKTPLHLKKLTS